MAIGLFSRCLGFNATLYAMTMDPEAFADVRCLAGPQPVTEKVILGHLIALAGIPSERRGDLEQRIRMKTSIGFGPRDPREWAKNCHVPTYVCQVHDDILTDPADVQEIYDNMPADDKCCTGLGTRPPGGTATSSSRNGRSASSTGLHGTCRNSVRPGSARAARRRP